LKHIRNTIDLYLKNGYSLIPIDGEKKPCIYWKKFQYQKAARDVIFSWFHQFCTYNIGIVTGQISQLAVIDVDNLSVLPDLRKKLPEITRTTRVKTNRGYHFYFHLNGNRLKSTNSLFGKNLELKCNGSYIIAPPSIIKNHRYTYEVPLNRIMTIPEKLIENNDDKLSNQNIIFKIPKYHGHKMDCIKQIFKRDLKEGERNNGLFILYNLLIQNKNSKEYAMKIVERKNSFLSNPLTELELKKIYLKSYHYGCSGIREKLPYVRCEYCTYRFKGGQLSGSNILIKNMRLLPELTSSQRSILCLLGTLFDGEKPSLNKIAKTAGMNYKTVKSSYDALKEKGILDDSFYD
jgi:hypothetical protein